MLQPRKTLPSARTRTAGVFCDTGTAPETGGNCGRKKTGERNQPQGLIPFPSARNYSRTDPGRARPSAKAQHVLHVVEARGLAREETRRAHRPLGIGRAAGGAMGDLDSLAGAREEYGVVAHDVPAARDREAHAAGTPFAGRAVAVEDAHLP